MHLELTTGQTIAFDRHGDPAARPVVLLHGLSGNRTTYSDVISHLLAGPVGGGELQVLNVDLRGHGDSGHASLEQYNSGSYAADIAELIKTVVGRPALVVGHSLGGVVAAKLAIDHPSVVLGLFLEDPPFFEGDAAVRNASPVAAFFPKLVAAVSDLQARSAPASDYEPLVAAMTTPADLAARCEGLTRWDPMTMQAAVDGIVWSDFDPEAKIICPLMILRADPACGAVFKAVDEPLVRAANPHANVVMVADAPHQIHGGPTAGAYLAQFDEFLQATDTLSPKG